MGRAGGSGVGNIYCQTQIDAHAECAMQERGIAVAWLDETLQDADAVDAGAATRSRCII
jgi:O-succinylbenzoate synthase